MRKKGGQRLMEMARGESSPVIEETTTVKRYTDSDRFEQPIMHDVGPIDEELPPAPPAPARRDLIGKMFPRLSAAMEMFGQIDLSQIRQARGDDARKKLDEAAGSALMDSVLVGQLADLENRLSLDITPKNVAQVQRKLDERQLKSVLTPIDEESASQEILKRLQTNRTKSTDPEVREAEKLAEIATPANRKAIKELAGGLAAGAPILAFKDVELESLLPQFGVEPPTKKNREALQLLVDGYEAETGEVRTVLQALIVLSHQEMDEEFHAWMAD
jgi:hypothetical protein